MLQRIRDGLQGQKWLAWTIVGLIGATFVFWGGSSTGDFGPAGNRTAAEVNGDELPASEAVEAWNDTQARWLQQFGTDIPDEQRVAMQQNVLDGLILRKLIEQRLDEERYRVSEAAVLARFEKVPEFQDAEGKFSAAAARSVLMQSGKTEREYFAETRMELLVSQLQRGLGGSYFLTPAEQQRLFNLENEEREVQFVQFPAEQFAGAGPIEDAAIQTYYEKNGDRFLTTESVSLDFAELRLEELAAQVVPTEEDLRQLYEDNRASYVLEESRRARHIVIGGEDDAAALAKAQSVLAEARAGKDFAELARQHSTDVTAADGGELGLIERRDFPGAIGDTLFTMQAGEVSEPVKSQFGYHLLKLEEIQPGEEQPFESVRAELDSQYRQERSADLFGDRQERIASSIEQGATDLDQMAQELGLTRGSVAEFLRGGGAQPLGSSLDLQRIVFSDATLNQGKVGGPVALGEDRLVLVKVTAHRKAEVKPLEVVRADIVELLIEERGVAAAKAAAEAALARLNAGEKLDDIAKPLNLAVEPARFMGRGDPSIPAALRTAIFNAPRPAEKPLYQSAAVDDGSTAVFVVTRTRVADNTNPALAQQQNAMLQQRSAQGDVAAYVSEMKRKAKIVKNPSVFE